MRRPLQLNKAKIFLSTARRNRLIPDSAPLDVHPS
jgi:hypothetical protein